MDINRISSPNNDYSIKKPAKTQAEKPVSAKDQVNISTGAQSKAEIASHIELVKSTPDIRADKVEAAKKNLASYMQDSQIKPEVLDTIVDRLAGLL